MNQVTWTDVANSAILKTGTQTITALTQNAVAARLCRTRLPISVPLIMRRYPWKSAMKFVQLSPLSVAPPDPTWSYAYPVPTDIVRIWRYQPTQVFFQGNRGTNFVVRAGQIWSNDGPNTPPSLTYVFNPFIADQLGVGPTTLDPLLIEALSCQLAVDIVYQLTESMSLKQSLQGELKVAIQAAKTVDSMETPEVFDWEASEFLSARFGSTGYMGPNNPGFPFQ